MHFKNLFTKQGFGCVFWCKPGAQDKSIFPGSESDNSINKHHLHFRDSVLFYQSRKEADTLLYTWMRNRGNTLHTQLQWVINAETLDIVQCAVLRDDQKTNKNQLKFKALSKPCIHHYTCHDTYPHNIQYGELLTTEQWRGEETRSTYMELSCGFLCPGTFQLPIFCLQLLI